MVLPVDEFSRISKLEVDRDGTDPDVVLARRRTFHLELVCGPEIAHSATLQAAVLTAANAAARCFPGAVRVVLPPTAAAMPTRLPPGLGATIRDVVESVAGRGGVVLDRHEANEFSRAIVFGTCADVAHGVQVSFDGWAAVVSPLSDRVRLAERDICVVAGVAAGALAVSEVFLDFAGVTVEATRRPVGLSLWRPDLTWNDADAVGPELRFAAAEAWFLGLGHLGQAFIWTLGLLPYVAPENVNVMLNDFDRVVTANVETGLLSDQRDIGRLKSHVALTWLERLGFRPAVVDRPFDAHTIRGLSEPRTAVCGFDGTGPRHLLDDAGFSTVIECGLGGASHNFDAISVHRLPDPERAASTIWPPADPELSRELTERLANDNPVYRRLGEALRCGHVELAGKAVAVPFVGALAASLVIAETLRPLHGGVAFRQIDVHLERPGDVKTHRAAEANCRVARRVTFQELRVTSIGATERPSMRVSG